MFNVGDFVKITNSVAVYITYLDFFKFNKIRGKKRHNPRSLTNSKSIYKILFIGKEEFSERDIYAIEETETKQIFLIDLVDYIRKMSAPIKTNT